MCFLRAIGFNFFGYSEIKGEEKKNQTIRVFIHNSHTFQDFWLKFLPEFNLYIVGGCVNFREIMLILRGIM